MPSISSRVPKTAKELGLPEAMLNRPVNEGFSGGERKRNELLQLSLLKPRLVLLDEIDSGMDVDGVRAVVALVQKLRAEGTSFIVVSHYLQMIEQLEPDAVLCRSGLHRRDRQPELARSIARTGFARACNQAVEARGHGQRKSRHLLAARSHLQQQGWIARKSEAFHHLPPPALEQWLGTPGAGRLRGPGLDGSGWTLHPIHNQHGNHASSGVHARWLDALDAAERAELFAGLPPPAATRPRPLPGRTARCAAWGCACASAPGRAVSASQVLQWC